MLRKKVVGEAVFPHLSVIKDFAQGAGVLHTFDLKGFFRAPPSPLLLSPRGAGRG